MKRIAIITGASSGFGREFALQLDLKFRCIDEYWLIARSKDNLLEVAKDMVHKTKIINLDLCEDESIDKIVKLVNKEKAFVKMLVNSAGFGKYGSVAYMDEDHIRDMIKLNCTALTLLTKRLIPYMDENSRIINLASSAAFLPQPEFSIYAATKSYVLSFTRSLNVELKKLSIYATAVCPGPSGTNFFNVAEGNQMAPWYKKALMAPPENIVELAIRDSINKEEVSVYGTIMRGFRLSAKYVPHSVILKCMGLKND